MYATISQRLKKMCIYACIWQGEREGAEEEVIEFWLPKSLLLPLPLSTYAALGVDREEQKDTRNYKVESYKIVNQGIHL